MFSTSRSFNLSQNIETRFNIPRGGQRVRATFELSILSSRLEIETASLSSANQSATYRPREADLVCNVSSN